MLPQAIREDHDQPGVVPATILPTRPTVNLLSFVRWTDFRCPHCHKVFRRDYLPHKVRLGNGIHICEKCGKAFDDGAREWPQLHWNEKLRCLMPVPLGGIFIGMLVCCILAMLIISRDQPITFVSASAIVGFSFVPVFIWWVFRVPQVYRSIHRYENEPASMRVSGTAGS